MKRDQLGRATPQGEYLTRRGFPAARAISCYLHKAHLQLIPYVALYKQTNSNGLIASNTLTLLLFLYRGFLYNEHEGW